MQLTDLVPIDDPEAVLKEVLAILDLIPQSVDADQVSSAFHKVCDLYGGNYPGYRACNTEYHDLRHVNETFLAMIRLLHGAILKKKALTDRHIILSLVSALLHDVGYLQEEDDHKGTGSKYTADHVQRSMDFLNSHGSEFGLQREEIRDGRSMILCTDLAADVAGITFPSVEVETLGKMLGVADLVAQMADRTYLEKLRYLYREFKEAGIGDFSSEDELLRRTVDFYDLVAQRFRTLLDSNDRFLRPHFAARWDIDADLYQEAIERQKRYLVEILGRPDFSSRVHLQRESVDQISKEYSQKAHSGTGKEN